MTKISDPLGRAFIEFCKTQGVRFVDAETGKEVSTDEKFKEDGTTVLGDVDNCSIDDDSSC